MKKSLYFLPLILVLSGCLDEGEQAQRMATEKLVNEATSQVGMPAIMNFKEKRILKDIYEMRDTEIVTFTYLANPIKGCVLYLGQSIGYGIPYSTQYSNPQKVQYQSLSIPQAEPNGLYMPDSAHGTWVMMLDKEAKKSRPVFIEPDVIISPFRLSEQECK